MITRVRADELITESLASLHRSGLLDSPVEVQPDTILFGTGAVLDSMAFVGFITDLEDRVSRETGAEWYLSLEELHDWNTESATGALTVNALAGYMTSVHG
jgi:hypothetical protein